MKPILNILFSIMVLSAGAQDYESFEEMTNNIVSNTIPFISSKELYQTESTKTKRLILDAREIKEFNVSHIKGAKHVGYNTFKISQLKNIDKKTIIIVYCSVGYRSEKVGEKIKEAGFTKVMNLKGGIFDWVNKGYPVYDEEEKETLKVHAYNESWGRWIKKGEKVYE